MVAMCKHIYFYSKHDWSPYYIHFVEDGVYIVLKYDSLYMIVMCVWHDDVVVKTSCWNELDIFAFVIDETKWLFLYTLH